MSLSYEAYLMCTHRFCFNYIHNTSILGEIDCDQRIILLEEWFSQQSYIGNEERRSG